MSYTTQFFQPNEAGSEDSTIRSGTGDRVPLRKCRRGRRNFSFAQNPQDFSFLVAFYSYSSFQDGYFNFSTTFFVFKSLYRFWYWSGISFSRVIHFLPCYISEFSRLEEVHQAFLSRVLLMFGSFVILVLLLIWFLHCWNAAAFFVPFVVRHCKGRLSALFVHVHVASSSVGLPLVCESIYFPKELDFAESSPPSWIFLCRCNIAFRPKH